ncbi:VanZ family protein [Hwangdonia lutea]|uniref:VanZ family protein n=1 Tax=Hwangdonia lutea TaxID=3075823 RepID=A0AA97HNJ0_9FLAO|nr:VanZ family protein [Hwangdonia sp. SCSIO 19198]WOD42091.1 VanZ family protein [Hwangdonia sp. SCSIO 19198]
MLKKYVFIITVFYTLGLATVSLMTLNNLPNVGINFADKIFHFIVYSVLAYLWFSTFYFKFKYKKRKAIWYAALFSIIFGIIIEVLQGSVTASRHSDVYDAIANTLGVLIMVSILLVNKKMHIKN